MAAMITHVPQSSAPSVFDEIRQGFAFVAQHLRHITLHEDAFAAYAQTLPVRHPAAIFDADHHFIGSAEATAAYVITLDAVNFGSGYEPHLVREGWSLVDQGIYFTVATRLKTRFEQGGISADALCQIGQEEISAMFALPHQPYAQELAGLFTQGLRDLGQMIAGRYNGSFLSFVDAAEGKASQIVRQMMALPQFRDIHVYQGKDIPLLKRAQSTAADLHDAFRHKGMTLFSDVDQITVLTDNDVPCVMRADGLMSYSDELAAMIDRGEELSVGSEAEVEIRACTGYIAERLAALKGVNAIAIDRVLWHKAAEDPFYRQQPTHRTRSTFY